MSYQWSDSGAAVATMRRIAADDRKPLRIPVVVQYRTKKDGQIVYRWKERYDRGAGDSSGEMMSRDECVSSAVARARNTSNV